MKTKVTSKSLFEILTPSTALWCCMGLLCLVGVLSGAWWHLATAGICAVMALVNFNEPRED